MSTRRRQLDYFWLLAAVLVWPAIGSAQVPVDEDGQPIGQVQPVEASEELAVLSSAQLEELIGPIALYPDDLLAIILPASTYPLQIVQAARFLDDLETDSSLKPDEDWDDSVVALTNYPEVVEMMSEDLDWTWRLGEAVVAQQTDVIKAIEAFRDRAYAAGNLKSDDFQKVTEEDGTIQIQPVQEDVIYVPYYEPEQVVVYQPRPVYYYYPRPYPVYYYPYPVGYSFHHGYFWGVTTAFSIGWFSDHLHVWHHSYHGHPYYGRHYWHDRYWYRRPDIHVYNDYYVRNRYDVTYDRYRRGDYWQPHTRRTIRPSDQRLTRTRYYPGSDSRGTTVTRSSGGSVSVPSTKNSHRTMARDRENEPRPDIQFRSREGTATTSQQALRSATPRPSMARPSAQSRTSTQARSSTQQRQTTNRQSYSPPSSSKQTFARSTPPKPQTSRSPLPKQSYSRSSAPKQAYSRPSTSRQSSSRPAPTRQSSSRSSAPKQSYSSPSKSRSSSPSSSRSSSSKNSHRSSRSSDRKR